MSSFAALQRYPMQWRRWAVLTLSLLMARYLFWRVSSTLNFTGPAVAGLSLLLLGCELVLLISAFLPLWFSLARRWPLKPQPLGRFPAVDLLLPSCGEPLEVVQRSLQGALALNYPKLTVWLLDDTGRPELQQLASQLGCRYRARAEHAHAKAGNLNAALPLLQGELVAVLDADVVPQRSFLERTVSLLEQDSSAALVQTPQSYMNADPVLRNLQLERWLLPDEESFYRWVEPVRQGVGAVVCAGTSFVVRRRALMAVGGFETGTPSEDLATGIRLAAAGWRLHFLAEKLSAGLAPHSAAAMARQRCRWASGTLQILRTGANPFTIAGLSPLQRLAFAEGILHWLNVLPQLLLLLMPLLAVLAGGSPIRLDGGGLMSVALPFYAAQMLLARPISGQARGAVLPELYRWIFLVPLVGAVLSTIAKRPKTFRVTPKAPGPARGADSGLVIPLAALLAVQGLTLIGLLRWPPPAAPLGLTLFWLSSSTLLLGLSLRCCWDRPGVSAVPWFAVQSKQSWGQVTALSEEGLEARLSGHQIPTQHWGLPLELVCQKGQRIGMHWKQLNAEQQRWLQQRLYGKSGCWPVRRAPFELRALGPVLLRLIRPASTETWFNRSLLPLELQGLASSPLTQASRPSPMNESASTRMNIATPG
jgi:cellulose synthase (UDP-forming)